MKTYSSTNSFTGAPHFVPVLSLTIEPDFRHKNHPHVEALDAGNALILQGFRPHELKNPYRPINQNLCSVIHRRYKHKICRKCVRPCHSRDPDVSILHRSPEHLQNSSVKLRHLIQIQDPTMGQRYFARTRRTPPLRTMLPT